MKTQSFVGFDALKQSVPIIRVLEHYGLADRLQRNGETLNGACPLHQGHNRSQFRVSLSKNCWICFGDCQAGGSIVDFVSRKEGIGIREAALLIQDWFPIQSNGTDFSQKNGTRNGHDPERVAAPAIRFRKTGNRPLQFRLQDLDCNHAYLKERELSRETIDAFGVGYCSKGTMAGRIVIPIHNSQGQLVAYAGRWPGNPSGFIPKYTLPKGFAKSLELFNLHRASAVSGNRPFVVVEGFFGCMKVWQAGHRRVVSIMGSRLSTAQEELIVRTAGPTGQIVLFFDEDQAGRKGREEAFQRLTTRLNVRIVTFDTDGMQPDRLSPQEIRNLIG
ncbi:MAG: CHC2 zinc finger domain-containing protein [Verrucomicrobia bacterium]|nr:CHC2 zinc finger domain-containing protein [Verrucomicrobiota bacterium]